MTRRHQDIPNLAYMKLRNPTYLQINWRISSHKYLVRCCTIVGAAAREATDPCRDPVSTSPTYTRWNQGSAHYFFVRLYHITRLCLNDVV